MGRLLVLIAAVSLAFALPAPAAESPLQLDTIPLEGGTLHLDHDLAAHRYAIHTGVQRFLADCSALAGESAILRERMPEVLKAINQVLGVTADERIAAAQQVAY